MKTKTDIEKSLDEALYLLEVQGTEPTLFQIDRFVEAIAECSRGAFAGAWNLALDVMAVNVADDPFQDKGATAKRLEGVTLEKLKRELHLLKLHHV